MIFESAKRQVRKGYMKLSIGTNLYRYCLGNDIPKEWSTEYHSPEYYSNEYGEKNQIGAFFFYRDEKTAYNVLTAAIEKAAKHGQNYQNNTLTYCQIIEDISILDLTYCDRPVQMLNILYDEGVDVLTSDFFLHPNKEQSFDTIRGYHQYIMDNRKTNDIKVCSEILNKADKINKFFKEHVGYTGQLLTDFGNGIPFKRLLEEKGYEGYQFMEEKSSPTICLFNSSKLTLPVHKIV